MKSYNHIKKTWNPKRKQYPKKIYVKAENVEVQSIANRIRGGLGGSEFHNLHDWFLSDA